MELHYHETTMSDLQKKWFARFVQHLNRSKCIEIAKKKCFFSSCKCNEHICSSSFSRRWQWHYQGLLQWFGKNIVMENKCETAILEEDTFDGIDGDFEDIFQDSYDNDISHDYSSNKELYGKAQNVMSEKQLLIKCF